jgi:hypothetical protein
MPLKSGKSSKTMSSNISEMMNSFKKGGNFAKGKSASKARQMAIAAAFSKKKETK